MVVEKLGLMMGVFLTPLHEVNMIERDRFLYHLIVYTLYMVKNIIILFCKILNYFFFRNNLDHNDLNDDHDYFSDHDKSPNYSDNPNNENTNIVDNIYNDDDNTNDYKNNINDRNEKHKT